MKGKEKTQGDERIRVTNVGDGVEITRWVREPIAGRGGKRPFKVEAQVLIPAALVPFVRDALPMPEPDHGNAIMDECDECRGEGEVQVHCDNCHAPLTTENQDPDEPEWCRRCVTEEAGQ